MFEGDIDDINVIEAYIKQKHQFIVTISGLLCSGKSKLAMLLASDLNMPIIEQRSMYKKDFVNKVKLSNGYEVNNHDVDDAIDWDLLNKAVNKYKEFGVIIIGTVFPTDKLKYKADYHVNVSISKTKCLEKQVEGILRNKKRFVEELKEHQSGNLALRLDELTLPYYKKTIENSIINKFVNANKLNEEEMYNVLFDSLIHYIEKTIYKGRTDISDADLYPSNIQNKQSKQIEKHNKDIDIKQQNDKETNDKTVKNINNKTIESTNEKDQSSTSS